ncbi:MAG: glucosidase [Verrucomicrobium sp.]|nr:glucosidase [Verrucomicrobium sp.]
MNPEQERLDAAYRKENPEPWLRWGPYLSERAWGTVREDYSPTGEAWDYFPHDHARSRAYRWNEDGLLGISDDRQILCLAYAFWNGRDPYLKERLFGVSGPEGNHGEDVKEAYFYQDNTPAHTSLSARYLYPQKAFPYEDLVKTSQKRTREEPEYEIWETGAFAENRYFEIDVAYAKEGPTDLHVEVRVTNRGPESAPFHFLPTFWFRNTWSWAKDREKPVLRAGAGNFLEALPTAQNRFAPYRLYFEQGGEALFVENETNTARLYQDGKTGFFKDGVHEWLVGGRKDAVNPQRTGTKAAVHFFADIPAGESRLWRLRLREEKPEETPLADPFSPAEAAFARRREEADRFYGEIQSDHLSEAERHIHRRALSGLLWNKQYYHFVVHQWLEGDATQPSPPYERKYGRNADWHHLYNSDVLSMPDKWEYPWYASWDLAFHCIPLALVDSEFAKGQIDLLLREWYQHPNGQLPAYEWNFGDVNPPVIAWAAWRVYKIEAKRRGGRADRAFLETVFHKLLLNFNWWVNRKDSEGRNIFQGGFLGLDNIGVFDRSKPLPGGGTLEQSDGTSWMGLFAMNMTKIAIELARENPVYQNIATKFFEHFLGIAEALNRLSGQGRGLWDEADQFFYDVLSMPDGRAQTLRVRSLVGLIPLLAVETVEEERLEEFPEFHRRMDWYLTHRPDLTGLISHWQEPGQKSRRLVALVRGHRMKRLLARMLDPNEFLSDYGIRSLSKDHEANPYVFRQDGTEACISYEPGESTSNLFGGNSNWRGPIWFPLNYLLIESLQKFHHYYGDDFKVECPTGSGQYMTLKCVADELSKRLMRLFEPQEDGGAAWMGQGTAREFWKGRKEVLFFEYFHGDTGAGLGANHQTGWTALVAKLLEQQAERRAAADKKG